MPIEENSRTGFKMLPTALLMKQKLPEYVVKCLMSAGYDEIEVVSTMGTSEKLKEI